MLSCLAVIIVVNTGLLIAMQTMYVVTYFRFLNSGRLKQKENEDQGNDDRPQAIEPGNAPRVAVVLCLRGADPSLPDCLNGLARQSYREFELHIVVDSPHDPSLEIADRFKQTHLHPIVHVLDEHPAQRSLKCSAILKAIRSIPERIETIAFLDADTMPDPEWLADLTRPLSHPKIGATTGNRWFQPDDPAAGSLLRQVWNGAAVVQMAIYDIAWGGSFAIKRSTLDSTNILERWSDSFCEDTLLTDELERKGLRLYRVPQLICLNTESTSLASAIPWISRQLLTTRLYHRRWPLVQLHALSIFLGSYGALAIAILLIATSDWKIASWVLVSMVVFLASSLILQAIIERANTRIVGQRYRLSSRPESRLSLRKLQAVILAQLVQPWACWRATFLKNVWWRGIRYRIGPGRQIRMTEYRPTQAWEGRPDTRARESIE